MICNDAERLQDIFLKHEVQTLYYLWIMSNAILYLYLEQYLLKTLAKCIFINSSAIIYI